MSAPPNHTGYVPSANSFNAPITVQDAPVRQAAIPAELEGLNRNVEELMLQLSILEDRLMPILTPTEPAQTGGTGTPEPSRPALAASLCDIKRRVATVGAKVASIIDRIEL